MATFCRAFGADHRPSALTIATSALTIVTETRSGELGFGGLENGVADLDAVRDGEDLRFLALATVGRKHDAVRDERLLHDPVIQKLTRVLHRSAARRAFLVFEPKHAQRTRA